MGRDISKNRRVVVTGVGILSPLGLSADEHFERLTAGQSGIAPISIFASPDFPVRFAGEVRGFKANRFIKNRKSIKIMARDIQLAVAASSLAAAHSGIHEGVNEPHRFGVSMGAGLIPSQLDELGVAVAAGLNADGGFDTARYGREGLPLLFPLWLLKYLPNMLNSHAALEYDARGPNNCITCGNASGLLAIGEAARVIERGQADIMLAGAAESKIHPLALARLHILGKLSSENDLPDRGPRPFCGSRAGLVAAEAGAVLVLEEQEHAAGRGAAALARVAGFGSSCGAQLSEELEHGGRAAADAMAAALADAGLDAGDVDAVFANASGLYEDDDEAVAIVNVFGRGKPVTTVKAAVGHSMAASGALELATAVLALSRGMLPATFGVESCGDTPVDLVSEKRRGDFGAFMINSFSFGGQAASLVIAR